MPHAARRNDTARAPAAGIAGARAAKVTVHRQDSVSCGWWGVMAPDRGALVSEQERHYAWCSSPLPTWISC